MSLQLIRKYTPAYSKVLPGYQETSIPVHYNPADGLFAVGEDDPYTPHWDNWYWNVKQKAARISAIKSAGVQDTDPIGTALTGVNPNRYATAHFIMETLDKAAKMGIKDVNKLIRNDAIRSAAILKREDFQAFKTIVQQTKIIASKPRRHIILDMVNVETVSDYNTKIYAFDGPFDVVQENLPELNIPNITGFPDFTPLSIGMERYGIHYAFSEEFLAEQFDFNIRQFVLDNIAGQMDIVFNKKVADVLNNQSTFTAAGDWTAKTGNISNRDPAEDINTEATKIDNTEKNEGLIVGSNRKTYNAFLGNYFMNGYGTPTYKQTNYSFGNAIVTNIPRFIGLDWGIDSFFTGQKLVVFDPAALVAYEMPQRIVDYTSQYGTHRGTIIRKNMISKPIDTSRLLGASALTP